MFELIFGDIAGLDYEVVKKSVILRKSTRRPFLKRTITGTVLDANGEPLPGASIYVKGDTKSGVTADADGRFTLSVPSKTKAIIVSFVGFNVVYILTRLMQCVNRFSCVSAWDVDSWCGGGVVRIRGW